jgi:hypothetical protein
MHHLFERLRFIRDVGWKDVAKDIAYGNSKTRRRTKKNQHWMQPTRFLFKNWLGFSAKGFLRTLLEDHWLSIP